MQIVISKYACHILLIIRNVNEFLEDKTALLVNREQRMFTVPLFRIAKTWKETKCPLIGEKMKNQRYTYMEHYSAIKKMEVLTSRTTWVTVKCVRLQNKICVPHHSFSMVFWKKRTTGAENWRGLPGLGVTGGVHYERA